MTANATIAVASATNALTVPIAALHTSTPATTPWGNVSTGTGGAITAGSEARLVVARDGKPTPVRVRVTLTNGTLAAVQPLDGNALSAGDAVVIGSTRKNGSRPASSTRSPMSGAPVGGAMRGIH